VDSVSYRSSVQALWAMRVRNCRSARRAVPASDIRITADSLRVTTGYLWTSTTRRGHRMKDVNRILVAVDPTLGSDVHAQRALRRGVELARRMDAELRVVAVGDYNDYLAGRRLVDLGGLEAAWQGYSASRHAWLEGIVNAAGAGSLSVSLEVAWDRPLHEGIVRQVLRYKPDLVLKDTHHHPAIARALLTNTDWHLIRECPAPLMLVRTDAWAAGAKILAAVDPLHEQDKPAALDRKILDVSSFMAQALGLELHVLHVLEPIEALVSLEEGYVPIAFAVEEITRKLRYEHEHALQSLLADRHLPAERIHFRRGSVRGELIAAAHELPAALVVMGAIARTRLKRVFLGSTAERVLESIPCDVLIVKPDGFECPVELNEDVPPAGLAA
jgi:universal stress protein E